MKYRFVISISLLAIISISGCASLDPGRDYERTAQHVESAFGESVDFHPDNENTIRLRVDELLRDGLTVGEAVQVCLLNNPRFQAELMKIGVARAGLVQSGLLSNPVLSFAPRWPDGGGLSNLQLGLAQNIAELWQLPYRRRAAERDLDRTLLEVADQASTSAYQTRLAYYRILRDERGAEIATENERLTSRLVDLAIGRRDAGAGSDVDVQLAKAQHADAKLRFGNATLAIAESRAEFVRLLGLTLAPENVLLVDSLPLTMLAAITPAELIGVARTARLDLKAASMAVDSAAARVDYERSRLIKSFELGVSAERNAQWSKSRGAGGLGLEGSAEITGDGLVPSVSVTPQPREPSRNEWVVGPSLNVELPIFDQNQAQIAKAEFVHRQATKLTEAIGQDVQRDAYIASARLKTAAENVRLFREELIPLRERVATLGEDGYRAGRTSFLVVVQAQQALQEARAGFVSALEAYAAALAEVERVAGCPYSGIVQSTIEAQGDREQTPELEPRIPTSMPAEARP